MAKSDYDKGVDKANEILGEDGLGRLGDDPEIQKALEDSKSYISKQEGVTAQAQDQYKRQQNFTSKWEKVADQGMDPAAREAMRTQMSQQMGQAAQIMGMKAGAAMGGMRGAGAAAQQRSLMSQALADKAGIERDVFLANEQTKMQGLQGMSQAMGMEQSALQGVGMSVAQERAAFGEYANRLGEVKTFDIGQAAAEKELRASMGMQYEQMAAAERAARMQAEAMIQAARIQCFLAGTPIVMLDGSVKNIEDILPGDEVLKGGYVSAIGVAQETVFYNWNGIVIGRGHAVKDKYGWVDIDYADNSKLVSVGVPHVVYNLVSDNHCLVVSGHEEFLVGDYYGAAAKSWWSMLYVPYKKLKKGISQFISDIFKSSIKEECNG